MNHQSSVSIRLRDGFRGQILYVIPRSIVQQLSVHPLLRSIAATDIGWYPNARYHYCERPVGAPEHILIYCTEGTGWYELEGARYMLDADEAVVLPANIPHIYGASERDPWSIYWVHFTGLEGDYYAQIPPGDTHRLTVDPQCGVELVKLFRQCYGSFVGGFVLPRLIHASKLVNHILGELFYNNPAFSSNMRTSRFHSLESVFAFLVDNLCRPVSLAEMASQADLSESQFSYTFRQQTGHPPLAYFNQLKMQHACMLLTVTHLSIHEIAGEIGVADSYYFSRLFKKIIGVSPSEYRNSIIKTKP
ncbi:MAG: AraC family transcriptional regulator [Caldilinea sp.]|uniref:AraC family transcriptional regulator n=1 Tax=Caldilinea sp. TaxID=2293560 RepID=UPI002CD88FD1|nr:helix-turn-helix domain-containing protein [Anaerolineales bacterium]HQY90292.1 AraC family transcriptional regulator [Caldilinea sp.]